MEDESFICFSGSLSLRASENFKSKFIFPMRNMTEILLITDEVIITPLHTACFTMQGITHSGVGSKDSQVLSEQWEDNCDVN